jgi:uncharacterized metal-binding protein YceD (DUF177 family)
MTEAPEFSRPVPLVRLGSEPFCQKIRASEAECAALARRFDLVALGRLGATVELTRRGAQTILLRAAFEAEFVQRCIITLDPVSGALCQQFALLYGPPESEEEAAALAGDEVAFEPLDGGAIDIGEAVAQEFSLALPLFPRSPDASVEPTAPPGEAGPFAALAQFLDRHDGKTR